MSKTVVEILDSSLNKVAEIRALYPLNNKGMILRYSKELSDFGRCSFRVAVRDPLFKTYGDILQPHTNHVRIRRGNTVVWQGVITDNPQRNKLFVEVMALEYLYYLDKVLVRRTSNNPATGAADSLYRIFNSGTMASAVSAIVTDAKSDFGANHPLSALTIGQIDNPNYPIGFTDSLGAAVSGGWNFSSTIQLQFDFTSVYKILKAFGIYASCDFRIDETMTFKFQTFLGNKQNNMVFQYGTRGNIVDYNLPRQGRRMVNDLWGIATDLNGQIFHTEQTSSGSLTQYGKLEDATGFTDVKDPNFLRTRIGQDLVFTATPSGTANVTLDENGYPLGQYDIGDIVVIKVKDNVINFQDKRRIVGITVNLHNTGRELTTVQTNIPKPGDLT